MHSEIIRQLLKKYAGNILLLLLLAVAMVLIGMIPIEMGRRIINLISTPASALGEHRQLLVRYCFLLLLAAALDGANAYTLSFMYSRFSQAFVSDIRMMLFNHLIRLPQSFFDRNPIGQITNRIMNEVGTIGTFFSRLFLSPIINMFMVVFYSVYLFRLNWKLAIAGTIFIPICVIILPIFNKRIQKLTDQSVDSSGGLTGYFQEVFAGIKDVRAGQTYFFEQFRLKNRLKEFVGINVNIAKTAGGLEAITLTIRQLGPLALYFYGGILCLNNEMTIGTLVASVVVINNLYGPANSIMGFFIEWRQVSVRFEKLDEYLRLESETGIFPSNGTATLPVGDIRFDKVRFGFTEDQALLNDINFSTGNGEKVAFVGSSGSGKSLTATLLGTTYKPLSGNISIGPKTIEAIPLYDLRTKIGYVNQTPFLFNDSIRNNIIYALLRKPEGVADSIESWVDFSLLDNIDSTELDRRVFEIVKDVGLFDDLINLGLRSRPVSPVNGITDSDKMQIVRIRNELTKEILVRNNEYVELYAEDKFLEYCSLFENIVFCPSDAVYTAFGSTREFYRVYLAKYLKNVGLLEGFFAIGLKLARKDTALFERLYKNKSPLLNSIELDEKEIGTRIKINERLAFSDIDIHTGLEKIEPALVEEVVSLALDHCPGRLKDDVLDDKVRKEIPGLRKNVRKYLSEKAHGKVEFYDYNVFNNSLSLMENMVFGTINPFRKKANEDINTLIREHIRKAGLEELVVRLGLEFKVGERGTRLSGGQRQKVVIARILLKNPSILILDEATAALDSASQARIAELIAEKYKDKTVISIAHRLNIIKEYDEILVFENGSILEQGTFEELMNMNGLFAKLYSGSN